MLYTPMCTKCGSTELEVKGIVNEQTIENDDSKQIIRTIGATCLNCHQEFTWDENYFLDSITNGALDNKYLIQNPDGTITPGD